MEQQWRQAELIDHVRLITVAEVADILIVRHIGFGNQGDIRSVNIHQCPEELHDLVRLRQMDTAAPDLFPDVGHSIHPDDSDATCDVEEEDIQILEEDIRVLEIDILLVITEGSPDQL